MKRPKAKSGLGVLQDVSEAAARLADTEDGRKLLTYLHEKVNSRSTYVPGDAYATHLREGMRVLYLHVRYLVELGQSGVSQPFTVSEEPPIWQQTRDITNLEELSAGDYSESSES